MRPIWVGKKTELCWITEKNSRNRIRFAAWLEINEMENKSRFWSIDSCWWSAGFTPSILLFDVVVDGAFSRFAVLRFGGRLSFLQRRKSAGFGQQFVGGCSAHVFLLQRSRSRCQPAFASLLSANLNGLIVLGRSPERGGKRHSCSHYFECSQFWRSAL